MSADDPPSPAEKGFLEMLSRPAEYARWAREVRQAWEWENVVWFHGYRDGKALWRRERPPPDRSDVDERDKAPARFQRA